MVVENSIFNLSRESIKNVFECGLGTNNPNIKSNMKKLWVQNIEN